MRIVRIGLIAVVAIPFAAVAGGKAAAPPQEGCRAAVGGASLALPAQLTIRTSCGVFLVDRDGSVRRISSDPSPAPRSVGWFPNGIWITSKHGHVIVGRWHQTLWRSSDRVPHASAVDDVIVRGRELVFSIYWRGSRTYVAKLDGGEHLVARGQYALGWARGGLYVVRNADGAVLLRNGKRAERIVGATARTAAYEASNATLYFAAHGRLFRADGTRVQLVTGLGRFGLSSERNVQLQPLGRFVALQGPHRLVVLRSDGSLLASTPLPSRRRDMLFSGQPAASPGGTAVAFAVLRPDHAIVSQRIERGVETVYLLRAGARAAVPIHREKMRFNVCGHGATLSWHGDWLLYSTGEGPAALIDTRGAHAIELTSLLGRLPGFSGVEEAGPLSVSWG